MLKVPQSSIWGSTKDYLSARQDEIDALVDYPAKVAKAKSSWEKKNAKVFEGLRGLLADLCQGARRCNYCEDSVADEVEHIWPKKFYPDKTFKWENYLFACGPCNGSSKRGQFALFDAMSNPVDLVRRTNDLAVEPMAGAAVFIDPRVDDPFDFIELDLATGIYVPCAPPGEISFVRAEYTIKVLGLNKRDYLVRARRNAYASYLDSARQYVVRKHAGAPCSELTQRIKEISERHHPSVWAEMKRLSTIPAHSAIFKAAPELLST